MCTYNTHGVRVTWPSAFSDILITGRLSDGCLAVSLERAEAAHIDVGGAGGGDQLEWMSVTEWPEVDGVEQIAVVEKIDDRKTIVLTIRRK